MVESYVNLSANTQKIYRYIMMENTIIHISGQSKAHSDLARSLLDPDANPHAFH